MSETSGRARQKKARLPADFCFPVRPQLSPLRLMFASYSAFGGVNFLGARRSNVRAARSSNKTGPGK